MTKGKTALPKDWQPGEPLRIWARVNAANIDLHATLAEFRDYAAGKDWRMADWDATARNWLRKASKAAKGKSTFAGAEKPTVPKSTAVTPHVQQCRWEAAANRILLMVLMGLQGVRNIDELVKAKGQMAAKLRRLYGNDDAPQEDWQRISKQGYAWLRGKAT